MYHIEYLLRETMGLDSASIGSSLIQRTARLRMKTLSLKKMEAYLRLVETSPVEMSELIESVVVTETWFFRDKEAFAALTRLVMNEWLPAHPVGLLRVLSAPCSSGEEPYSAAMALLDAGLPPDRFEIDALDISARALAQAERAVYGKNSFRTPDLSFRDRYFQQSKDGHGLNELVRSRVFFKRGNLLDEQCLTVKGLYDFIFCRNLLIYFDRPTQAKVLQKLSQLLTPTGLCFVGPAELPLVVNNGFVSANLPMAFACRRADTPPLPLPERRQRPLTPLKVLARSPVISPPAAAAKRHPPARAELQPPKDAKKIAAPKNLDTAQRLADAGKLADAAALCEAHLREQGPSAQAYYLLGLVRDADGDTSQAVAHYRKALYLQPKHGDALLQLSLLAEKSGDATAARLLRQRARRASLPAPSLARQTGKLNQTVS